MTSTVTLSNTFLRANANTSSAGQETPRILWEQNLRYRVQNDPPLVRILNHMNHFHNTRSCVLRSILLLLLLLLLFLLCLSVSISQWYIFRHLHVFTFFFLRNSERMCNLICPVRGEYYFKRRSCSASEKFPIFSRTFTRLSLFFGKQTGLDKH